MTVVQQTLSKPGTAVPWPNAKVVVALVGPGFVSGGQVLGDEFDLTDTAGFVSFDLAPTDTMTPSGCYYVWTGPDGVQWSFTVPASGGPYQLQTTLVGSPSMPTLPVGVTQASLTAQLAGYVAGKKTSTDGSHGLSAPTGVGLEFVFTAAGLDDIRYDGVSQ